MDACFCSQFFSPTRQVCDAERVNSDSVQYRLPSGFFLTLLSVAEDSLLSSKYMTIASQKERNKERKDVDMAIRVFTNT
jgi:hypothetical protein